MCSKQKEPSIDMIWCNDVSHSDMKTILWLSVLSVEWSNEMFELKWPQAIAMSSIGY